MRHRQLRLGLLSIIFGSGVVARADAVTGDEIQLGPAFALDLNEPWFHTALGVDLQGPPPWPDGNHVSIGEWRIANMHFENLNRLRSDFHFKFLLVRPIDKSRVIIVDERIDQRWLLNHPRWGSFEERLALVNRHRNHFARLPAEVTDLFGKDWELVEHKNNRNSTPPNVPPNYREIMLPANRIEFQELGILFKDDAGKNQAVRRWLVSRSHDRIRLTLCAENPYSERLCATSFKLAVSADRISLAPEWWYHSDCASTNLQTDDRNERFLYQRVASRTESENQPPATAWN